MEISPQPDGDSTSSTVKRKRGRPPKDPNNPKRSLPADPAAASSTAGGPEQAASKKQPSERLSLRTIQTLTTYTADDIEHIKSLQQRISRVTQQQVSSLNALNRNLPPGGEFCTKSQLIKSLLPFHLYDAIRDTAASVLPVPGGGKTLSEIQKALEDFDASFAKRSSLLCPTELLLIEQKLFLEEERYIFKWMSDQFEKRFGVPYTTAPKDDEETAAQF